MSANVPLIPITARSTYNVNEIQQSLADYLPNRQLPDLAQEPLAEIIAPQSSNNEKVCPECASKMTKKIAKKGKNIGNEFWACSAFPKCRHIEKINA